MTRSRRRRYIVTLVGAVAAVQAILVLGSCASAAGPALRLYPFVPIGPQGHVIVVVIDGLRPDLISQESAPTLMRLIGEGAATLDARTVEPSLTLPAITSMVTGVEPRIHRMTWNHYEPDRGVVEVATIFHVARGAGLRTALFAGKSKLLHLALPSAIDRMVVRDVPGAIVAREARRYLLEARPNLMLVHLPDVDQAGHQFGWGDQRQRQALRGVDALLQELVAVLESGELEGPAIIIVTADHGGTGRLHERRSSANRRVPWVIWGDGVSPRKLSSLSVTVAAATVVRALGLTSPAAMEAYRDGP